MSESTVCNQSSDKARLFSTGKIVATPDAIQALENAGHSASEFLVRHALGDWGDLCDEDKLANDEAVKNGLRILSAYKLSDGTRIWIITEAKSERGTRSATTILLPENY